MIGGFADSVAGFGKRDRECDGLAHANSQEYPGFPSHPGQRTETLTQPVGLLALGLDAESAARSATGQTPRGLPQLIERAVRNLRQENDL